MISLYGNGVMHQVVTIWLERVASHTWTAGTQDVTKQVSCKCKDSVLQGHNESPAPGSQESAVSLLAHALASSVPGT